jgi:hypothetical protein
LHHLFSFVSDTSFRTQVLRLKNMLQRNHHQLADKGLGDKLFLRFYDLIQQVVTATSGRISPPFDIANQVLEHPPQLPGTAKKAQVFQVKDTHPALPGSPTNSPKSLYANKQRQALQIKR